MSVLKTQTQYCRALTGFGLGKYTFLPGDVLAMDGDFPAPLSAWLASDTTVERVSEVPAGTKVIRVTREDLAWMPAAPPAAPAELMTRGDLKVAFGLPWSTDDFDLAVTLGCPRACGRKNYRTTGDGRVIDDGEPVFSARAFGAWINGIRHLSL